RKLRYPELGGCVVVAYNHDQKVFGNAYMIMAVAKFWIVRSRYVDFYFRAATGLSFSSRIYHPVDNRANNAIGSVINSADQFRLGIDLKPSDQVHFTIGLTLTHYSNTAAKLPNLGV